MKSIINKIRFFGMVITTLLVLILSINIYLNMDTEKNAKIVNIAGKQRMLAQKITNELYILKVSNSLDYQNLDGLIQAYIQNLDYLRFGDEKETPVVNEKIAGLREDLALKWSTYLNEVAGLKQELNTIRREREINADLVEQILMVSETVVDLLERNGFDSKMINIAGRQRMLTQKMAYHNINYLITGREYDYQQFTEAYTMYDQTLQSFYDDPRIKKIGDIHEVIAVNVNFWQDYARTLKKMIETNRTINTILKEIKSRNNDLILTADTLVSEYQNHFASQRTWFSYVQYIFSFIAFVVVLSLANIINDIKSHFDTFLLKTKNLTNFDKNESTKEYILEKSGEAELDEASSNINAFITKVESAIICSDEAVRHSEKAIDQINALVDSMEERSGGKDTDNQTRRDLSRNEDMAIQSSEELLQAIAILNKLKENLSVYKDKMA